MKAIHVSSLTPRKEKFDLYNTVLSALTWRKYNGEIVHICDSESAQFYSKLGVWDAVKPLIPDDLEGINPQMFWAAGKLLALREVSSPVVMLDKDFIVWKKLDLGSSIIAAHREDLHSDIYPDVSYFQMKPEYTFNPAFDYSVLPLNTAFLYLPDEDFKQFYVNMAIEFMKSAHDCNDNIKYMVYAEQRLLALCADYLKQPVETLLEKDKIFELQDDYTHLWGEKQKMRENPEYEREFNARCKARIRRDFPEFEQVIDLIERI
ncbi:MAG: hypothetical protein FWD48_05540 [Oscillospiraceae bacterium]|nr:hypothetical protein [Oscillospiraceae bacterium]